MAALSSLVSTILEAQRGQAVKTRRDSQEMVLEVAMEAERIGSF